MQLVIHRGTKQIGGSCIELFYQGTRIVLDFGLPLDAPGDVNLKEHIPSTFRERLNNSSKSLSAVLLSHAHPDHYGLFKLLPSDVPVYCGQSTAKLISAASIFSNSQKLPTEPCIFRSNKPFMIPPFRITPKLMDHSAFDAHGFLIEAEGQSLFYTGDFRMHGRKYRLMESLIKNPPDADILIMEGTVLGDRIDELMLDERELEERFVDCIRDSKGLVSVTTSSQQIDRLVTIFRAARQNNRKIAIDLYTAHILDSLSDNPKIPKTDWPPIRVVFNKFLADRFEQKGMDRVLVRMRSQLVK